MTIQPFKPIEKAVKAVIEQWYPDHVGGDSSFESGEDYYIQIAGVTGSTNQVSGEWVLDIDVFADSYSRAQEIALALEATLLGSPHRTDGLILDRCYQNEAPADRPWPDDNVTRLGAVYGFTARRSG